MLWNLYFRCLLISVSVVGIAGVFRLRQLGAVALMSEGATGGMGKREF